MAYNVSIYKNGIQLATGSATNATKTISSVSATSSRTIGSGRNVQITATGGNNVGATVCTQVVTDGGTSLTIADASTFT